MMKFDAIIKYVPGKFHFSADALSCRPRFNVMTSGEDIMEGHPKLHQFVPNKLDQYKDKVGFKYLLRRSEKITIIGS